MLFLKYNLNCITIRLDAFNNDSCFVVSIVSIASTVSASASALASALALGRQNEHPSFVKDRLVGCCPYDCLLTLKVRVKSKDRNDANEHQKLTQNEHPNSFSVRIDKPLSLYTLICFVTLKVCANEHLNEHQNEHRTSNHNEHPNSFNVSKDKLISLSPSLNPSCSNRSLLALSGDVEKNPGPLRQDVDEHDPLDDVSEQHGQDQDHGRVRCPKVTKSDLQVLTLNIRGLSDPKKVRHLVNSFYKITSNSNNSFFMLQETFVARLDILNYLWRGEYHLTPGTGNSKGCLTLVTAPYKIVKAKDIGNRAHVIVLTKNSPDTADLILVNVYAPNGHDDEKVRFFEELTDLVSETAATYNCSNIILAGDLNVVFSEQEIKNRLYSNAERRVANNIRALLGNLNLEDGWESAPEKHFTWSSSRTGVQAYSTLDRVMYTRGIFRLIEKRSDWALSLSDHAAVTASLNLRVSRPNKSSQLPRLDPRLLLDEEGCRLLDARFRELVDQQMDGWNPHVRLEYYKMSIRTATNDAVGKVKAKLRDTELILNEDINRVIEELSCDGLEPGRKVLLMNKLDDLRQLKRSLVEKIGTRLEQKTARKWYNEGELSNKYFFNLLNRRTNGEITTIIGENGEEIKEPQRIEEKIRNFYRDLYESVPDETNDGTDDTLFRHIEQVLPEEGARMQECITLDELTTTLKNCVDSAPGPDGIPYSFLKHFWADYGQVLLESWQYSLSSGDLPPSHKVSYLRLIPKAGKDARVISNLRPITLSNTDHKLVTKTYAAKLTEVVARCIGEEQTAYIPGRLINDNVRSMLMTVDLANVDLNVDGVVVSLDAKKAFDSVDHKYIKKCLTAFGLDMFIPTFNVLYKDLNSKIILNGNVVDGYKILRGVKQGDALSCIIFIICMEPLIRNLKANVNIKPIVSNHLRFEIPKVYSFADDITLLAKNEPIGVQEIFNEYEAFSNASGLLLNADKTEILCFNGQRALRQYNVNYNGANYVLQSTDRIKVNGITFLQDQDAREEINVMKTIESMERLLRSWSTRRLTLLGRILIIKTFAMSKMIYLMQTLTLSEKSYKAFTQIVFKFLWNRNFDAARAPERLKRSIMYTPISLGGFGMADIRALGDSLDLRSYGRLLTSRHPFMSQLKLQLKSDNFFNQFFDGHVDKKAIRSQSLLNVNRLSALQWPKELLLRDANFRVMLNCHKLKELLTAAGKQSIPYLSIHRRAPRPSISELTLRELGSIERYLIYPNLAGIMRELISAPLPGLIHGNMEISEIYASKDKRLVKVSAMSSKSLRLNQVVSEDQMICVYKLGPIMAPGEVLSWTTRLKKLTSTRHKNILLRAMHGDIFSNNRLARFGLRQDGKCANCPELNESIIHKIKECPVANEAWLELERAKPELGLRNLSDLSLENLIGAKDKVSKFELALQAELIHKLTSRNDKYCPKLLVKSVIKLIGYAERLPTELKEKFNSWLSN